MTAAVELWKAESSRFSTDPELVGKVTDVCGPHLAQLQNAIVLCVDETPQIQSPALDQVSAKGPFEIRRVARLQGDPEE